MSGKERRLKIKTFKGMCLEAIEGDMNTWLRNFHPADIKNIVINGIMCDDCDYIGYITYNVLI